MKFDENFGNLAKLKQTSTIREYQGHFEKPLSCVGRLLPSQQVSCFISGLKELLRVDLNQLLWSQMSFSTATTSMRENEESLPLSLSTSKTVKKLSLVELNERRNKGLYFNCDEKFAPGHRCKKLFFYWSELPWWTRRRFP